ncbi:DUF2255 family protein [Agrococcus sp. Marseille-Q4369]|uniref:DUF2255 family protein n=1 Tax=Agrococcus sp. Marseille-Q4369 TaxID=2810513 RepID=UPI001B8D91ED|nr:DUF2255 family protein [Agrococcus sp. Marseille-Q4369]QUW19309.1 DUF2255 family protein [Agrococcus sp. Marseille-Q4369]
MSAPRDPEELAVIGLTEELHLSSRRPDGSLSPAITIWAVAVGDEVVVRSAYGERNGWYRRALERGAGRIRCGDVEQDVEIVDGSGLDQRAIDDEYRRRYARFEPPIVATAVGHAHTLRLRPA